MATYTDPNPASGAQFMSVSQPLITGNFTYLHQNIGKDHNFSGTSNVSVSNPDGYHTNIHQQAVSKPTNITGVNQLYVKTLPNGDTGLFSQSGSGVETQLTISNPGANFAGNVVYLPGFTGGWTSLPGGLILQYGLATINLTGTMSGATTVPFPITFTSASAVFSIVVTGIQPNNNTNSLQIKTGSVTATNFIIENNSSAGQTQMYWTAIGK
jgi:hypothetical protein